jgi:multidrug transporter EmrE-like cation transporter
VLVGPFVIGSFSPEPAPTHVLIIHLFVFMVAVFGLYMLSVLVVTAKPGLRGLVLSGFAGAIGGFVMLFQKVSTTAFAQSSSFVDKLDPSSPLARFAAGSTGELLVRVFANPYALTWILLSLLSMFVLQLSYRYDKAIRIVPSFGANYLLVPIVGGVLVFQERLHPMNWVGVGIILLGVGLLLSRGGEHQEPEGSP